MPAAVLFEIGIDGIPNERCSRGLCLFRQGIKSFNLIVIHIDKRAHDASIDMHIEYHIAFHAIKASHGRMRRVAAHGINRDPARSSQGHFAKPSGLRRLTFMLLTSRPWTAMTKVLPILTARVSTFLNIFPGLKAEDFQEG
jgi:hypothetical protein